jgi:hypothetical protein
VFGERGIDSTKNTACIYWRIANPLSFLVLDLKIRTNGKRVGCHSEPVEERCAKALPAMLRQVQYDSAIFVVTAAPLYLKTYWYNH